MSEPTQTESTPSPRDRRLYMPESEAWGCEVKKDGEREFCFRKNIGEDFFHLLLQGEIYVRRGNEKFCLNCAFALNLLTEDRLFWQNRSRSKPASEM